MHTYRTEFELTAPVNDLESAQEFLTEDDMVQYFKDSNPDTGEFIESITWILEDNQHGYIEVVSTKELTGEELSQLSQFVYTENADGLGEGFEQREFAYDEENDEIASFDYEYNDYIFGKL